MNTHFKCYDIVLIFNLLDFKIEEVLFEIARIDNRIII